jgi:mevalonate kinase
MGADATQASKVSYRGSAAGKVILLGEHAVVYGSRALVVGLDQGAEAEVRSAAISELVLGAERHRLAAAPGAAESVPARAFRALLQALGAPSVAARAQLAIPAGAGLGASAALGVALARGVTQLLGAAGLPQPAVAPAALAWENVFHGNASGVDTAAAEHAGCLSFRRGEAPQRLRPGRELQLVVALVENGASTLRMVEGVAERRATDRARMDARLDAIAALVLRAQRCVEGGDLLELGQLMTQNHELLLELGVSTPGLDRAVRSALDHGALGAKLTGAGGGGCVVALVGAGGGAAVIEEWRRQGLACWEKRVGRAL